MNATSDRIFGGIYVNITTSAKSNRQEVLNATEQLNYIINTFSIGPDMKYQTISSVPVGPYYGVGYTAGVQPTLVNKILKTGFNYVQTTSPGSGFVNLNLFNTYQQFVYQSPLKLYINSTAQAYLGGYGGIIGYPRPVVYREGKLRGMQAWIQ